MSKNRAAKPKTESDLDAFQRFSRKPLKYIAPVKPAIGSNCVIYTRVSSKKQEDGYSLDIQLEAIEEYAKKHGFNISGYFGGKYESAQTDKERKEFNKMLQFIKKSKEKINFVLVYTVDRFSRTGINGAYIKDSLRQQGIELIAVKSPIDTSNSGGRLQQNIQFIFSEYDNDLRREKCTEGMIEMLEEGYWVGRCPLGYDMKSVKGEQVITINNTGKLIRQAFIWKAQGVPHTEICVRLKSRGLKIYKQKLEWILKNPFYCGLISHGLLNGKVVEGKHPPIISKDIFLNIHEVFQKNRHSKVRKEFLDTPLKHFIKCGTCGTPFSGYVVKKKGISYYKCNKIGCRCNKRADYLNQKFLDYLKGYQISDALIQPLKDELINTFNIINQENIENANKIKDKLATLQKDIDTVEERWALAKINEETYTRVISTLRSEKSQYTEKLKIVDFELSNLKEYIDLSVKISANLVNLWRMEDYFLKEELQNLVFPNGIYYDREKDGYRTDKVNSAFVINATLSKYLEENKKRPAGKNSGWSNWVGPVGIEPTTP